MPDRAYKLIVRDGLNQASLATAFGVTEAAISQWKEEHPEFLKSLKKGWEDFATGEISKSLACRAKGYSHPETKIFANVVGGVGGGVEITEREVIKHYPPDPVSAIFWLCNWSRRNGNTEWMQTNKLEVSGKLQTEETGPAAKALAELLKASPIDNIRTFRDSVQQIVEGANGHCKS